MNDDSNLLLAERLKQRAAFGKAKYGVALKPWDGRNTVVDAIEEALDLAVYLTKLQQERAEVAAFLYEVETELLGFGKIGMVELAGMAKDMYERLTADIPRIGSKSEAEIERETWAAVKGPNERLADMSVAT